MAISLSSSTTFLHDDRLHTRAWSTTTEEYVSHLLLGMAKDTEAWRFRPEMRPPVCLIWAETRAILGLPFFLRRRVRQVAPAIPQVFAFVKSKCWDPRGGHVCTKIGHSCVRRVVDMAGTTFKKGWRTMGRAVRAVVAGTGLSREVFSMDDVVPALQETLSHLSPPERAVTEEGSSGWPCECCGVCMNGLSCAAVDVDQAFEACKGQSVMSAWGRTARRFQERWKVDYVMVQRGRKCVTRIGPSRWNRAWWVLSLSQLGYALKASTMISLACVGEIVVEMPGLCIGGVMSSAAVAVQLGDEEA